MNTLEVGGRGIIPEEQGLARDWKTKFYAWIGASLGVIGDKELVTPGRPYTRLSRRKFLQAGAASGALALLNACAPVEKVSDDELTNFIIGGEKPLSQGGLNYLIQKLNEINPVNQNENYTATVFVKESLYKAFKDNNGESFDMFLDRHSRYFNSMLKKSDIPAGFQILRGIVVKDDVQVPYSHYDEWINTGLKDSDGMWFLDDPSYDHRKSWFYNDQLKIDFGFLHEMSHTVLHLNDQYALDYNSKGVENPRLLERLNEKWSRYVGFFRNDRMGDLMTGDGPRSAVGYTGFLREYTALQLKRRGSAFHDFQRWLPDLKGWRAELPKSCSLIVQDDTGNQVDWVGVEFYRTTGYKGEGRYDKVLLEQPVLQVGQEPFETEKIFRVNNDLIDPLEATFFVIATDRGGKQYIRWMDIRDFNIPYWKGLTEQVKMTMRFVAMDRLYLINPESLDYTIEYSE